MSVDFVIWNGILALFLVRSHVFKRMGRNYDTLYGTSALIFIHIVCNIFYIVLENSEYLDIIKYILALSFLFFPFAFVEIYNNFFSKRL